MGVLGCCQSLTTEPNEDFGVGNGYDTMPLLKFYSIEGCMLLCRMAAPLILRDGEISRRSRL